MKAYPQNNKGFTLVELLVVISIISFLSSIVLSALSSAQGKARDSLIIQEVTQLSTMLELEFNTTKSYAGGWTYLTWIDTANDCTYSGFFSSTNYGPKMREICNIILKNETGVSNLLIWPAAADSARISTYTIMVKLPNSGLYYCKGSNGKSSTGGPYWSGLGCYLDPTL